MNITKTIRSFRHAFAGMYHALQNHQNLKVHIAAAVFTTIITIFLDIPKVEFLMVVFAIMFVIFAEMVNTSIEEMTDLITQEHRQEAKIAKDIASAAVLIASIFAIVVALVVFVPRLF